MFLAAIPASVSGIKAVGRQELMQLGLQSDLLQLIYINGEWLYRFENVLSLAGLVVLAVLVYASGVRAWTPRAYRLLIGLLALVGLGAGLGFLNRWSLNALLRDSYRNDERLLSLTSTLGSDRPLEVTAEQAIEPVNLEPIKKRGTLRVGCRSDGLPLA